MGETGNDKRATSARAAEVRGLDNRMIAQPASRGILKARGSTVTAQRANTLPYPMSMYRSKVIGQRPKTPPPEMVKFARGSTITVRRPQIAGVSSVSPAMAMSAKPQLLGKIRGVNHTSHEERSSVSQEMDKALGGAPWSARTVPVDNATKLAKEASSASDASLRAIKNEIVAQHEAENSSLFFDEKTSAQLVLSFLRHTQPELNGASLDRLLNMLSNDPGAYSFFARLTRQEELAEYLSSKGSAFGRLAGADPLTPADTLVFSTGLAGGAAFGQIENYVQLPLLIKDVGYAFYVVIGRHWNPALDEPYKNFKVAINELRHHPLVTISQGYQDELSEIDRLWNLRRYGPAGFRLGRMLMGLAFAARDVSHFGSRALGVVRSLPAITISTANLQLLKEFAKFYLRTETQSVGRLVLKDGSVLQKVEQSIILIRPGENPVKLDLAALTPDELKQFGTLVGDERALTSNLGTSNRLGTTTADALSSEGSATGATDRFSADRATGPSYADVSSELEIDEPGKVRHKSQAAAALEAHRDPPLVTAFRPGFHTHRVAKEIRKAFNLSWKRWESTHVVPQVVYRSLRAAGMQVSEGRALTILLPKSANRAFDRLWIARWNAAIRARRTITAGDVYTWVSASLDKVKASVINDAVKAVIHDRLQIELFGELGLTSESVIVAGHD